MPIYSYLCKNCNKKFDLLVLLNQDTSSIGCPYCFKNDLKRLFSSFAISNKGKDIDSINSSGGKCSSCSGGSCSSCGQ